MVLTLVNIWTVNRGNAAATADRIMVLAANAEELYILKANLGFSMRDNSWTTTKDSQIGVDEIR